MLIWPQNIHELVDLIIYLIIMPYIFANVMAPKFPSKYGHVLDILNFIHQELKNYKEIFFLVLWIDFMRSWWIHQALEPKVAYDLKVSWGPGLSCLENSSIQVMFEYIGLPTYYSQLLFLWAWVSFFLAIYIVFFTTMGKSNLVKMLVALLSLFPIAVAYSPQSLKDLMLLHDFFFFKIYSPMPRSIYIQLVQHYCFVYDVPYSEYGLFNHIYLHKYNIDPSICELSDYQDAICRDIVNYKQG